MLRYGDHKSRAVCWRRPARATARAAPRPLAGCGRVSRVWPSISAERAHGGHLPP